MIYLTFDTNIWINSLDNSWLIDNQLDYLEQWVEDGFVKILLPQMVIDEWYRHRSIRSKERENILNKFFVMAADILPSAFFYEYNNPTTQQAIIAAQLARD